MRFVRKAQRNMTDDTRSRTTQMKRNCIFILVDCLRADKCWGGDKSAKTPNLDRLSSSGTTFTQAVATVPVTTPSVASILTGLYPFRHRLRSLHGNKLNPNVVTLAERLRQSDYHTYADVTGPLMPQVGIDRGFEQYSLRERLNNMYSPWYDGLLAKFRHKEFIEPYFVFLHFFDLHKPRTLAQEYDNSDYGRNRYDRALSSLDGQLGKLLDCIDDETVIILHADHGEKIAETMIQEKNSQKH